MLISQNHLFFCLSAYIPIEQIRDTHEEKSPHVHVSKLESVVMSQCLWGDLHVPFLIGLRSADWRSSEEEEEMAQWRQGRARGERRRRKRRRRKWAWRGGVNLNSRRKC